MDFYLQDLPTLSIYDENISVARCIAKTFSHEGCLRESVDCYIPCTIALISVKKSVECSRILKAIAD